MTRQLTALGLLLLIVSASETLGQEPTARRTAGGARRFPVASANTTRSRAASSQASKRLTSNQAHSLINLPYRRNFEPTVVGQSGVASNASDDLNIVTTVYGGSSGPYVMAHYSNGGYGRSAGPLGLANFSFTFPYAYGRLSTPYSYGVYGYPYYSFYRPSFAYSVWGWPGVSPLGNFGYGGYGLPYGYYGLGGYNYPFGYGGIGFPYGRAGIGYPYGYGGAYYW